MTNAAQLVLDFERRGSPLGKSIMEEEIPRLITQLTERLRTSNEVLDLTPKSLDDLAKMLLDYYQVKNQGGYLFTDEETIQIIREIAAYFGKVVLDHSKGKWNIRGGLWGTEIIFEGPVKTKKGSQTITHNSRVFSLGQIASAIWTALQKGIEPKLIWGFQSVISKNPKGAL